MRSGRRPWGGGPAGGLTCSGEGPLTPARGKSKMAASAETEKDRGGSGGGGGRGPRDARPRLDRGRRGGGGYRNRAPPNYKAQTASRTPIF